LLEAVAALAIVGATSASILATTGAGVRAAERARRAHEASALADETMARIALLSDEALRMLPDSISGGTFAAPFDEYDWEASVQGDAQFAGLFTVAVSVQWEGGVQSTTTALYRRPVVRTNGTSVDRP
jgi:type II secretory pathway pseudopilin PulG